MPISIDSLLDGARPKKSIQKVSATAEGAGTFHSLWKVAGSPTAGANPTAFGTAGPFIPTNATLGSMAQPNPGAGNELRLTSLEASGATAGKLIIYDRLWACSGFTTNITSLQSINTPDIVSSGRLPAGPDYSDVELWLEVYTAPGATGATWTIIAIDGGGTSRTMTYTHPANAESVGQMMMVAPLAAAAAGFRNPVSFQCSVSSGTAGDIGITLLRRIASIDMAIINTGAFRSALDLGLPTVRTDACLAMMVQCTTTNTGLILGDVGISEITP